MNFNASMNLQYKVIKNTEYQESFYSNDPEGCVPKWTSNNYIPVVAVVVVGIQSSKRYVNEGHHIASSSSISIILHLFFLHNFTFF